MQDKNELKQALQKALSMEEDGYKVYTKGAEKIKNSLGKKMLERLAQDELNHINRIKEIYAYISGASEEKINIGKPRIADFKEIFNRLKNQLDEAVEDLSEVGVDDQEIVDIGLELETHAKFFYTEQAKKTDEPLVKQFYELMAAEEQSHYDVLRNANKKIFCLLELTTANVNIVRKGKIF